MYDLFSKDATMKIYNAMKKMSSCRKFYVYLLVDPRNNTVFYVGKGCNDRVNGQTRRTNSTVKEIEDSGKKVIREIIRHGMDEETALHVEATLIDFFNSDYQKGKLFNAQSGFWQALHGRTSDIKNFLRLQSPPTLKESQIKENVIVININKTFRAKSLLEATRKSWRIDLEKARKTDLVFCEYQGVIRAVFKPGKWRKNPEDNDRIMFSGKDVSAEYPQYIYKELSKKRGAQNPIRYFMKNK